MSIPSSAATTKLFSGAFSPWLNNRATPAGPQHRHGCRTVPYLKKYARHTVLEGPDRQELYRGMWRNCGSPILMELLRGSGLGITRNFRTMRFSTQNTFYKAFRRRFGISPSAVRAAGTTQADRFLSFCQNGRGVHALPFFMRLSLAGALMPTDKTHRCAGLQNAGTGRLGRVSLPNRAVCTAGAAGPSAASRVKVKALSGTFSRNSRRYPFCPQGLVNYKACERAAIRFLPDQAHIARPHRLPVQTVHTDDLLQARRVLPPQPESSIQAAAARP